MSTRSKVIVGIDEAGLGPTLGPMVVAAFATRSPSPDAASRLSQVLSEAIGEPGCKAPLIEVGDSKKIHSGRHKLARIERTVLATLMWATGEFPGTAGELLRSVCLPTPSPREDHCAPWWHDLDDPLPLAADRNAIEESAERLAACAEAHGVEALSYRADVHSVARINRELEAEDEHPGGSKNTWATHAVLRCARSLWGELARDDAPPLSIECDKAGGRNAYSEPLSRAFPGAAISRLDERREYGRYEVSPPTGPRFEIGFRMGGDRFEKRISWASCLAKYLREILLRSFNRHFQSMIPELKATAGYPQDAKRFIAEVEGSGVQTNLQPQHWIRAK